MQVGGRGGAPRLGHGLGRARDLRMERRGAQIPHPGGTGADQRAATGGAEPTIGPRIGRLPRSPPVIESVPALASTRVYGPFPSKLPVAPATPGRKCAKSCQTGRPARQRPVGHLLLENRDDVRMQAVIDLLRDREHRREQALDRRELHERRVQRRQKTLALGLGDDRPELLNRVRHLRDERRRDLQHRRERLRQVDNRGSERSIAASVAGATCSS